MMFRRATLQKYPESASAQVASLDINVGIAWQRRLDDLTLHYEVRGDVAALLLPTKTLAQRRDELWRHTCAELFVAVPGQAAYVEYNFSPATAWAAYQFDDYRQGMRPLDVSAPQIVVQVHDAALRIEVLCALPASLRAEVVLQVGLTMVIEDKQGALAYWALKHPAGKPDFHHRDGFVLEL